MTTLKSTGPLFYAASTKPNPITGEVPAGKIHVHFVRYESYEYDLKEFEEQKVVVHNANSPEAKLIAALVALPPNDGKKKKKGQ